MKNEWANHGALHLQQPLMADWGGMDTYVQPITEQEWPPKRQNIRMAMMRCHLMLKKELANKQMYWEWIKNEYMNKQMNKSTNRQKWIWWQVLQLWMSNLKQYNTQNILGYNQQRELNSAWHYTLDIGLHIKHVSNTTTEIWIAYCNCYHPQKMSLHWNLYILVC